MKIGDRIRVKESVNVYHHPKHISDQKPFDIQGMEGEIVEIIDKPITANFPVKIQFEKKFSAHLREEEIEVISSI